MQLLADRFAVADEEGGTGSDRQAIDLVSGSSVMLRTGVAGGASEQVRWAGRCAAWHQLQHPALARLLDYGLIGESRWFEAWQCGARWPQTCARSEEALKTASRFLWACGLNVGPLGTDRVYECAGRPVVAPDGDAGETPGEADPEAVGPAGSIEACGMARIDRPAVRAIADVFESLAGSRPHVIRLWGPPGSGKRTALLDIACAARLHGFVPVGARVAATIDAGMVRDRSLCLINDDPAETRWTTLLEAALGSPRPHVLLLIGCDEMPSVHGVGLEPVPSSVLVGAVRPRRLSDPLRRKIEHAARLAAGRPGEFVRMLWPGLVCSGAGARAARPGAFPRVAEQGSVYGAGSGSPRRPHAGHRLWPVAEELAALRRRAAAAADLLQRGRFAAGVRQSRQAIGALVRRDDWQPATAAGLALASGLLRRGRAGEARAVLEDAKVHATRAATDTLLIDIAVLSGHVRIDLGQLDEAESVIGAALAAARRSGEPARTASASLALARCLLWRGRYADAAAALALPPGVTLPGDLAMRATVSTIKAAIALRDFSRTMGLVAEAAGQAGSSADPARIALAQYAAGLAHLAVGDLAAVEDDVRRSIEAARTARDPLRAVRARLLLAEADRRRGRRGSAAAWVNRVHRVAANCLPPIVRARVDLLRTLLADPTSTAEVVERHAAQTGLAALRLFVEVDRGRSLASSIHPVEDLLRILHVCQTADEEVDVLREVCAQLKRQLNASAVAFAVLDGPGVRVIAGEGARIDGDAARRAASAGVAIGPSHSGDRLEGAAPVRYGGAMIGVLAARWAIGTEYDLSRSAAVLSMAATAAAPVLSAAVARRAPPAASACPELLGPSAPMTELRRTIERAAAAPFAVLIEGESGTGKELVARAIHRAGLRRDRPLCTLNCAALPDELVEAELFGHARGAFTGAVAERTGVFEEAHGSSLLLDEVGELSPRAQAKLLRVLQEGEIRRIGENLSRRVDVRILSATNRDLRQEAASGQFRLDLLYRLDVIRIAVSPIRERREDIVVLVDHFWREATARLGSRAVLGVPTRAALARYDWPGNVRELQNVLAALAVRSARRGVVPLAALPPPFSSEPAPGCRLEDARRTFEERFVRAALVRCGGHRARAASELGLTRQGLTKLMARLGIGDPPRPSDGQPPSSGE